MKLDVWEALKLVKQVREGVKENRELRFGQLLFNSLPEDLKEEIYMTDDDFFYWTNDDNVLCVFYRKCVKPVS